jgi:hypothetical protein
VPSSRPGGLGQAALDGPGEPEVGHLDPAVPPEQDVLRLDVAVHQPGLVRGGQRPQHRLEQVQRLPGRQRPVVDDVAQGAPLDVLHHQVGGAAHGVGALVVDGHHVGAGQLGRRARLPHEAVDEVRVLREGRPHHLHRDGPVQRQVGAAVHGGHPAAGDLALQPVPAVEQHPDQRVGHGSATGSAGSAGRRPRAEGRVHDAGV